MNGHKNKREKLAAVLIQSLKEEAEAKNGLAVLKSHYKAEEEMLGDRASAARARADEARKELSKLERSLPTRRKR